jgi:hypothetical protein
MTGVKGYCNELQQNRLAVAWKDEGERNTNAHQRRNAKAGDYAVHDTCTNRPSARSDARDAGVALRQKGPATKGSVMRAFTATNTTSARSCGLVNWGQTCLGSGSTARCLLDWKPVVKRKVTEVRVKKKEGREGVGGWG